MNGNIGTEKEIVRNLVVDVTKDGSLILESLVSQLKLKGYYLDGAAFAYYSRQHEIYICCATDPIPKTSIIPPEDYPTQHSPLIIRAKLAPLAQDTLNAGNGESPEVKEKKRPKERKISFVISKVLEWRKLYAGMIDDNGQIIKYSLEEAADKVGIAKKSLDDYMLQLRLGKKYGYDFQQNKDKKIGDLRSFIKAKRMHEKFGNGENMVDGSAEENSDAAEAMDDDDSGVAKPKPTKAGGRKKQTVKGK